MITAQLPHNAKLIRQNLISRTDQLGAEIALQMGVECDQHLSDAQLEPLYQGHSVSQLLDLLISRRKTLDCLIRRSIEED